LKLAASSNNWRGIMRMLVCYEEILKEKKSSSLELDFFKSHSGAVAAPPLPLDTKLDGTDNSLEFKRKGLLLKHSFVFYLI
jgi:hypothetical protein